MATVLESNPAAGGPGIEPRWTRSDKEGVGTAYSALSRIWFTISKGIVNEVYYPTIDRPQIRDLQFLISDGETFFSDERRLDNSHGCLISDALGFHIVNTDPEGRFRIEKEIITDPHRNCLLIRTIFETDEKIRDKLRLYALLAPHLESGGRNNSGNVVQTDWGTVLSAHKGNTWLALAASIPFIRSSCGYVGSTDGWQDLAHDFRMDWQYDSAPNGNIALIGELDIRRGLEFVLALAFGESLHHTLVTLAQSLGTPFESHRSRFIEQWHRVCRRIAPKMTAVTGDDGCLYHVSQNTLLAHEDKTYDGALIASLSIPWGEYTSDDLEGYYLVWTRDMCHSASGLLATGNTEIPLRALIYLAWTQKEDGGFDQNFWIDGEPHWRRIQLDETAFPVILAWRLRKADALRNFDPYPMVLKAAGYLIRHGPISPQERWEENGGFSPSTLAAHIAALVCAAAFSRERGRETTARYFEEYADFLESHVESWTATTEGTLVPGIRRHYIRIHPADANDPQAGEDPNLGMLELRNRRPGTSGIFPAKDIVDAGFLELVRYGIRRPGDALVEDSLRVVDAVLKVETPYGPCWRRYNHDGYGQREDGGPFQGWGYGHAWPLLTGERGHYELAAGRDARPYLQAMERFASSTKLLPEQVWALPDLPAAHMFLGRPTGGAMPLAWTHAEYIKLARSIADGEVFDLIPEVADRYRNRRKSPPMEIWKFNRQARSAFAGGTLRIQADAAFRLLWTGDQWNRTDAIDSTGLDTGQHFADIRIPAAQRAPIDFTFFWKSANHWEGRNYPVGIIEAEAGDGFADGKSHADTETNGKASRLTPTAK